MQPLFSSLIEVYRKAGGSCHSSTLSYKIDNDDDIALIKTVSSDINYDKTGIDADLDSLIVGETVQLDIKSPDPMFGRLYQGFKEFLKGDFHRELAPDKSSLVPYYIEATNYASTDDSTPNKIIAYNAIKDLLSSLESVSIYVDTKSKKIIFVSKQTFELSYDVSSDLDAFEAVIEKFSDSLDQNLKVLKDFCAWIDVNEVNRHSNEKKSILASVLSDIQTSSKQLNICDVVENIDRIYIAAQGQFDNYLEDFKYEKFVEKLEENSEKFISRINDSISKVLSQILALPIAAAAPAILKGSNSNSQVIIYIALLIYAAICGFALATQKAVLDNLKSEVSEFEAQGKLPQSLKTRWTEEKSKIDELIKRQNRLYWVMRAVVYMVIVYSLCMGLASL